MMRRFLPRFSLVTAIVLMFAAGGLLWLNLGENPKLGWPIYFQDSVRIDGESFANNWRTLGLFETFRWVAFDLAIAVLILLLIGIFTEKIVHELYRNPPEDTNDVH